jgi:hypothetical protein
MYQITSTHDCKFVSRYRTHSLGNKHLTKAFPRYPKTLLSMVSASELYKSVYFGTKSRVEAGWMALRVVGGVKGSPISGGLTGPPGPWGYGCEDLAL